MKGITDFQFVLNEIKDNRKNFEESGQEKDAELIATLIKIKYGDCLDSFIPKLISKLN